MSSVALVERFIVLCFWLSPYRWVDALLEAGENANQRGGRDTAGLRAARYALSELYIVAWLVLGVGLWLAQASLPAWLIWPALLRVFGMLDKELGVILFGRCKITAGRQVAATGRTIVLALENYVAAAFLMAFVHTKAGRFGEAATGLAPGDALIQSLSIQFSLTPAFTPADGIGWALVLYQSGFAFLFSLIVISLFVSLLEFGASRH